MTTRPDLDAIEERLSYTTNSFVGTHEEAAIWFRALLTYCLEMEKEKRQAEALTTGAYQDGERAIERAGKLEHDLRCLQDSTVDRKAWDQAQSKIAELEEENKRLQGELWKFNRPYTGGASA